MRRTGILLTLGLCASGVTHAAFAAPARGGEIELHIEASAVIPPDRAQTSFSIRAGGETRAAAEASIAMQRQHILSKLNEKGIGSDRVTFGQVNVDRPIDSAQEAACAAAEAAAEAAMDAAAAAPNSNFRNSRRNIRSRGGACADATSVDLVQSVSLEHDATLAISSDELIFQASDTRFDDYSSGNNTVFRNSDPAKAKERALAGAIASAHADAEAHASALGYRVVRMIRVSNARPTANIPDLLHFIPKMEGGRRMASHMQSTIIATVAVDYVIAPK